MRKSLRWSVLSLALIHSSPSVAQQPNPVLEHYRAYRAALEANDLGAAENAAEAALAASEARDGDGGRTAVLALNLAHLRLDAGRAEEALEPARRAQQIVAALRNDSGVDTLIAELALGRAELGSRGARAQGERRLTAALSAVESSVTPPVEAYAAASELGERASADENWVLSQRAWAVASRTATSHGLAPLYSARALVRYSQASLAPHIEHRSHLVPLSVAADAAEKLAGAIRQLEATVKAVQWGNAPDHEELYAEALAWTLALRARLIAEHGALPNELPLYVPEDLEAGAPRDARAPCTLRVSSRDMRALVSMTFATLPNRQFRELAVVIMALELDASGAVTRGEPVAHAGDSALRADVSRAAARVGWNVEIVGEPPSDCRMERTILWPYVRVWRPHPGDQ